MRTTVLAAALAVLPSLAFADARADDPTPPAPSQKPPKMTPLACGSYGEISGVLTERQMQMRFTGFVGESRLVQLWFGRGAGAWAVVTIEPTTRTCVMAAGPAFRTVPTFQGEDFGERSA